MEQSPIEWMMTKLRSLGVTKEEHHELLCQLELEAKEMENDHRGYSKDDVREMLFMALNEPKETCCTTHTQDSIVRKVLSTFKSE